MSEKVKVSRGIAEAIEYEIERLKDCTTLSTKAIKNLILQDSINHTHRGKAKELNDIATFDLAEMLINGYEIEYTPEEKIRDLYKKHSEKHLKYIRENNNFDLRYHQGYVFGMYEALEILGKKIDGVNLNY